MALPSFKNEPLGDFKNNPAPRRRMEYAIDEIRDELGREYDVVIAGERIKTEKKLYSYNPSHPEQVVAVFSQGDASLADRAVLKADEAFKSWSKTPVAKRVDLLLKTSKILLDRKYYYEARLVYEVGKTWPEADADFAEAIDFIEFYARSVQRIALQQTLPSITGEKNHLRYIPLGVGIIIPPWNFPLAITVGMTVAAIVTGNTVVLKPSSDAPFIAYKFFEALEEAGMPPGVVNFLPAPGGEVGDTLVGHPRTRFVAFTGSRDVGLHINELAARTAPGQIWVKRVIAEMGGKNSIIVEADADLDEAVDGVVASAFGYQGQKCSACSRAIVLGPIYDAFLEKLRQRVAEITVGPADRADSYMGPVINAKAKESILKYIEIGKTEGQLVAGGGPSAGSGHFIQPAVIADVPPTARIAQEEIFGPVLSVIRAESFEQALVIANNTQYGLTGAVYTRDRRKMDKATEEFFVGNLYFNRKCTGAQVGAHPFGGFNMSGTDSKAGGNDYLMLFTQAKVISEQMDY
jgi:1-pyrroline-5-carboxylate dehydrogenase